MRLLATVFALLILLTGCVSGNPKAVVELDEGLEYALVELARANSSRPLKELAPGDWTSVQVFTGPISGARLQRELGKPVAVDSDVVYGGDHLQDGNLLVFLRGDEIIRMVSLGGLAALGEGKYRSDVILQARGGAITMTEPDGRPAGG